MVSEKPAGAAPDETGDESDQGRAFAAMQIGNAGSADVDDQAGFDVSGTPPSDTPATPAEDPDTAPGSDAEDRRARFP